MAQWLEIETLSHVHSLFRFQNLINGIFTQPSSQNSFLRYNPANHDDLIAEGNLAASSDVRQALGSARAAAPDWRVTPTALRIHLIERALSNLKLSVDELAATITRENGKPISEATAETQNAIDTARQHLQFVAELSSTTRTKRGDVNGALIYEPLGTAVLITPWNYPVATILRKLVPALVTGNTVTLKPSELTPASALLVCRAFLNAGLAPGVLNLIAGDGEVGEAILNDGDFDAISFTGSTTVGLHIAASVGVRDVRTQLEMGGKNTLIVLEDADLDAAATAAMAGGFTCAGQWCVGTSRILVHRRIYKQFLNILIARLSEVRVGDGLDSSTTMGPLISEGHFKKVLGYLNQAADSDGVIRVGGPHGADARHGWFVRPTLMVDPSLTSPSWKEEIFGPVLATREFHSLDEAVQLCNQSEYGLSVAAFTTSYDSAKYLIGALDYGRVSINVSTGVTHALLPHGGRRQSGRGEPENGIHGLRFFTHHKSVYLAGFDMDPIVGATVQ